MKVVAYSIKEFEKEFLARANKKQHDITLISNTLSLETAMYAEGKEAVLVFTNDDVSESVINKLADLGIKFIATRSIETDHIDCQAASLRNIKVANVPSFSPQSIAEYSVMLALYLSCKIVPTVNSSKAFDFRIDQHIGFNFFGKTVGIIGLGKVGKATAAIYKGMGCRVIACDILNLEPLQGIEMCSLEGIFEESDILSLHVPINENTKCLINSHSLSKMKDGVMLINTSSGELIEYSDVLHALKSLKLAYLGLDGYEFEKSLFFIDHHRDINRDHILEQLMSFSNVIISSHQAFLTKEALQEIANITIKTLDNWHAGKCSGKACACYDGCKKSISNS
jgi:D-lactate dehydrogenase